MYGSDDVIRRLTPFNYNMLLLTDWTRVSELHQSLWVVCPQWLKHTPLAPAFQWFYSRDIHPGNQHFSEKNPWGHIEYHSSPYTSTDSVLRTWLLSQHRAQPALDQVPGRSMLWLRLKFQTFGEEFSSENLLLCSSSKVHGDIWKQSVPTVNLNMAPGEVSIWK